MIKEHTVSTKTKKSNTQTPVRREVVMVDNHKPKTTSVQELKSIIEKMHVIRDNYNLQQPAVEALLDICFNWWGGMPSTIYGLSRKPLKDDLTGWHYKVVRLKRKGLVDNCGKGNNNCNAWAPTNLGESVVKWLCEA